MGTRQETSVTSGYAPRHLNKSSDVHHQIALPPRSAEAKATKLSWTSQKKKTNDAQRPLCLRTFGGQLHRFSQGRGTTAPRPFHTCASASYSSTSSVSPLLLKPSTTLSLPSYATTFENSRACSRCSIACQNPCIRVMGLNRWQVCELSTTSDNNQLPLPHGSTKTTSYTPRSRRNAQEYTTFAQCQRAHPP